MLKPQVMVTEQPQYLDEYWGKKKLLVMVTEAATVLDDFGLKKRRKKSGIG